MTTIPVNPLAAAAKKAVIKYRTHTAPGSIVFASGKRVSCPDGIISPSTPEEEAELSAAAACGNISVITDEEAAAIVSTLTSEAGSNIAGLK